MIAAEVDREFLRTSPGRVPSRVLAQALFEGRPPMTRGAILDVVTRRHLAAVARSWNGERVTRPIFIIGVGRSGTTLLGRLLASHPDVGYLKEPKALWHEVHPGEDVSGFYNTGDSRFVMHADDVTPDVARRAHRLFNWFGAVTRSKRVVDKYPEMTYRVPFLRAIFPDAVVIGIVRDVDAVVSSIVRYSEEMADNRGNWWGVGDAKWLAMIDEFGPTLAEIGLPVTAETKPRDRALAEWVLGARALCDPNHQVDHLLRYEQLLAEPATVMSELLQVAGLAHDSTPVRYAESVVGRPKTVSGDAANWPNVVQGLRDQLGYIDDRK